MVKAEKTNKNLETKHVFKWIFDANLPQIATSIKFSMNQLFILPAYIKPSASVYFEELGPSQLKSGKHF